MLHAPINIIYYIIYYIQTDKRIYEHLTVFLGMIQKSRITIYIQVMKGAVSRISLFIFGFKHIFDYIAYIYWQNKRSTNNNSSNIFRIFCKVRSIQLDRNPPFPLSGYATQSFPAKKKMFLIMWKANDAYHVLIYIYI